LTTARATAEAAATFIPAVRLGRAARMGQVIIDRSLPLGRALIRGAATGTIAGGTWGTANVLTDRGIAAVEGRAYGGTLAGDAESVAMNSLVGGAGGTLLGPFFGRLQILPAARSVRKLESALPDATTRRQKAYITYILKEIAALQSSSPDVTQTWR
jgi:hypothetical protein